MEKWLQGDNKYTFLVCEVTDSINTHLENCCVRYQPCIGVTCLTILFIYTKHLARLLD